MNLTQAGLSERSGVSLGTLKLFERSGTVSLETLVKIAFALEAEDGFSSLFPSSEPLSIDDILEKPKRIRGRRA